MAADWEGFPVQPKFQRGEKVLLTVILDGKKKVLRAAIQHVRASVRLQENPDADLVNGIAYGYTVRFEPGQVPDWFRIGEVCSERELRHANPLLRLVDET